jgi:hypothetical protein
VIAVGIIGFAVGLVALLQRDPLLPTSFSAVCVFGFAALLRYQSRGTCFGECLDYKNVSPRGLGDSDSPALELPPITLDTD